MTSLRTKLTFLMMGSMSAGIAISFAFLAVNEVNEFKNEKIRHVRLLADALTQDFTRLELLRDQSHRADIAYRLRSFPDIRYVITFDRHRNRVFYYNRPDLPPLSPQEAKEGHTGYRNVLLDFYEVLRLEGTDCGTIFMQLDTPDVMARIRSRILILGVCGLSAIGLAFFLSSRVQMFIVDPIVRLATLAKQVSERGDYSIRLTRPSGKVRQDEIGFLESNFNEMLGRIQSQLEREKHFSALSAIANEAKEHAQQLEGKQKELEDAYEQLKSTQAQIVQSEKMAGLGQIAAGVAHEINNPVGFVMSNLGTLKGYVDTFKRLLGEYASLVPALKEGRAEDGRTILARIEEIREKEDLDYIQKDVDQLLSESTEGTHRIKEIVQGLKSFAHIDEAQVKEANVNDCIETTLKVIWNELKYKCDVVKHLGDLPLIRCYPGQLNQVFMNLLINAAQAIPERGEIRIETEASDTEVIVRISDTGSGISKENLGKLFNPFFTTKPVGKGTGLGLSIVFGIVQKHGGTIDVQSEVGKGTTFTIRLPLRGGGGYES